MVLLFVPRERTAGERRVAATPETVTKLVAEGAVVLVEAGAGTPARFADDDYRRAGAQITDAVDGWQRADLICKVGPILVDDPPEASWIRQGATVLGLLAPHRNLDAVRVLAERRVTALAMELVPRITRAQRMDALSSQATIAGYRAVVLAAHLLDKAFPLFMTAAGTIRPATVVVLGAGVAGLQAVGTARRLGAVVQVSDIREAARDEVESLGATFIDLPELGGGEGEGGYARAVGEDFLERQRQILAEHLAGADAVIATAFVPGRPAPALVTEDMVARMPAGSVVVDLAAGEGGNCTLTQAGREVEHLGVRILGPVNLPSTAPREASALFARNVLELVRLLLRDGELAIDLDDDIVAACVVTMAGEVRHEPTAALLNRMVHQ
jgi:H+-translocating NAD(P) transhydrogenase subunit alpha